MNGSKDELPMSPCVRQSWGELLVVLAESSARLAKDLQKGPASETRFVELQAVADSLRRVEQRAGPCCMTVEEVERTVRRTMSVGAFSPSGRHNISAEKGAFPKSNAPLYVRVEDFRHDLNQMLTGSAKARGDLDQLQYQMKSLKPLLDDASAAIALLRSEGRGVGESIAEQRVGLQEVHESRRGLEHQLRSAQDRIDVLGEALKAHAVDLTGIREVVGGLRNQSASDMRHMERHVEQGQRSLEDRIAALQNEVHSNAVATSERFDKLDVLVTTDRTNLKHRLTELTERLAGLGACQESNFAELRKFVDEAEARCLKRSEEQCSSLTNLISTEVKLAEQKHSRNLEGVERRVDGMESEQRATKNECESVRRNDHADIDKRFREFERALEVLKSTSRENEGTQRNEIEIWMQAQLDEASAKIQRALHGLAETTEANSELMGCVEEKLGSATESLQLQLGIVSEEQRQCKDEYKQWRCEFGDAVRSLEVEKDRMWSLSVEIQKGLEIVAQRTAASLDKFGTRLQEERTVTVEGFKNLERLVEEQIGNTSMVLRKAFGQDLKSFDSECQTKQLALQNQTTTLQNDVRALQGALDTDRDAMAQRSSQESKRFSNMLKTASDEMGNALSKHRSEARAEQGQLKETLKTEMTSQDERVQSSLAAISEQVKWLSGAFERGEADATRRHEQLHSALSVAHELATTAKEEAVSAMQRATASEISTRGALSQRDAEIRILLEGVTPLRSKLLSDPA